MKRLMPLLLLGLVLLVGCDPQAEAVRAKAGTAKDFSANWLMMTVEHDGHKFIVGTYGSARTYQGAMLHHPDCPCKAAK